MNKLIEKLIEIRGGHYCHVIEVSDVYELECIADSICDEFERQYPKETIIDFLESLEVYCLDDAKESEIFAFSFTEYIGSSLDGTFETECELNLVQELVNEFLEIKNN